MNKISLVSRRKDKYFDLPTQASRRARERQEADQASGQPPPPAPPSTPPKDVTVSTEEGIPTVEVDVPADQHLNLEQVSSAFLHGQKQSSVMASVEKRKIGDKWELKLQFMPDQPAKMLTAKQLGQMFGVSAETIYALRKKGVIKGYKVGHSLRFNWSEVLESLEQKDGK